MDMRDVVTFALMQEISSVVHRPNIGERVKGGKEKRTVPREVGPLDTTSLTRSEGTTVQMCGDSTVAKKLINLFLRGQEIQR